MDVIDAGDPRHDEARALFNTMIDKRPAVIARCETPADVIDVVERACAQGCEVAVRARGHPVAGKSVNDGGAVVDVHPMKVIEEEAMKATAGAPRPSRPRTGEKEMVTATPALAEHIQKRQLEKSVSWTGRERLRCLWYRLRLTVQEMNHATRRIVELQAPWIL
jgi:hypothetical protein